MAYIDLDWKKAQCLLFTKWKQDLYGNSSIKIEELHKNISHIESSYPIDCRASDSF